MDKHYPIAMEVEGDLAMFRQPDSGPDSTSYPSPTYSAVKGMIESVLFDPRTEVVPFKVHICRIPHFVEAGFNAHASHLRKGSQISGGNSLQVRQLCIYQPCYQLFAYVKNIKRDKINNAHSFQDRFNRRLKRGQSFRRVCLGLSDFPAAYVGPIREDSEPCKKFSTVIPLMLKHPFDQTQGGKIDKCKIQWYQNVTIDEGVMVYA